MKRYDIIQISEKSTFYPKYQGLIATILWVDEYYQTAIVFLSKYTKYISISMTDLIPTDMKDSPQNFLGQHYEVSSDLVLDDDMSFFEGMIRLPNEFWKVLILRKSDDIRKPEYQEGIWDSGIKGLEIVVDKNFIINSNTIESLLIAYYQINKWQWIQGPDSMVFR